MRLIDLKCPCCNANIDIEDGIDTFYCKYCGTRIILEGQSRDSINAKVKIKEFEHVERIKDKEFAQERFRVEKENDQKRFELKWAYMPFILGGAIFLLVFGGLWLSSRRVVRNLENLSLEIESDYASGDYDSALMKANRLVYDADWSSDEERAWEKKRRFYIEMIEKAKKEAITLDENMIQMPQSSGGFQGQKYQEVVSALQAAGFTSIETLELPEDNSFFKKVGVVDHISVNGRTTFSKEDYFKKDSNITVYYYPSE